MKVLKIFQHSTALLFFSVLSSNAAEIPDEETLTVVATGNKRSTFDVPAMVNVVNNDTPFTQNANTAGGLLSSIAGVTRAGVGRTNGQTFNLRGYDKSGVLVLVDGIKQNSDMAKSSSTFLDPALVSRVEVVRGAASSLYGSGGLGGVIDFRTTDASDLLDTGQSSGIRLFSSASSGDHSLGAGVTWFGKTDSLDGILSVIQRQRGDIYQSDGESAPDREKPGSLFAKGTWQLENAQKVSANVRVFSNTTTEPGNPTVSRSSADGSEYRRHTTQKDAQFNYELTPENNAWVDLQTRVYTSELNMQARPEGSATEWRKNTSLGTAITNRSYLQQSLATHQITSGVEYSQQRQKPSGAATLYPDGRIDFASMLLQDEITLRELPVSLIIGTRYDDYKSSNPQHGEITASHWSPKAALSITPTPWLMFFSSVSSAFRAPTMGEMYRDDVHFYSRGKPNYWVPNLDLAPETNTSQEYGAGISLDSLFSDEDTLQIKASYFNTKAKDYIATRVDMKNMYSYSFNVPQARLWGWDAQANYVSDVIHWQLTYNRTEGMDSDSREWLGNISPDTVISDITAPLSWEGVSAGWRSTLVAPARHVKANAETQAGYVIHAFSLGYSSPFSKNGLTTSLVLDNVFNKEAYSVQGLPLSGRSAGVFLSYQW